MFGRISKYYDMIMSPFDYRELVDCLDDLIVSCNGKRTDVLDLGCGTSEELVYFAQLGYGVRGIDISPEMISISKNKLPFGQFYKADIRNYVSDRKFDNAVSVFDTVNYITKPEEVSDFFRCVNRSLNKDGLFLFDFNSIYGLINEWEGVKIEETEDFFISYDSVFDRETSVLECRMKFFIKEEDGRFITFDETHYERGYTPVEMITMLNENGFEKLKLLPFLGRRQTRSKKLDRYQIVAKKIGEA